MRTSVRSLPNAPAPSVVASMANVAPEATPIRIRSRLTPRVPMQSAETQAAEVQVEAPAPTVQAVSNSGPVLAELEKAIQDYATHNAVKNSATSAEKKAKTLTNKLMAANDLTSHTYVCDVGGDKITFEAAIKESTVEVVDPRLLWDMIGGDKEMFFSLVSIAQTKMTEVLGKNAVIKCMTTVTKPADLSISRVKA